MSGEKVEISQIAETLQRDTRTIKKAMHDINNVRKTCSDKITTMVSDWD